MLLVEKVSVLKSTEIFKETPDHVLASLATIVRVLQLDGGHCFIHQGELEDDMYVIVEGHVQVEVDGRRVATLGPGEVVGEMQVIDPVPRSASVSTTGETVLFCLGKDAFDQVMEDRPEIARAINRLLVRRLRRAQNGASVTSANQALSNQ